MDKDIQVSVPAQTGVNNITEFFNTQRLTEMARMAESFAKSGAFGADIKGNGYAALVKIQAGFEMGMAPMEAMNSLYIVNGHVSIYGSAMVKRLRRFGWTLKYDDQPKSCTVTVKKGDEEYSFTSTEDMMVKSQAYKFAPMEKLRYHAISRIIRFNIPEVMDAGITYLKEEIEDMPMAEIKEVEASFSLDEALAKVIEAKTGDELQAAILEINKSQGVTAEQRDEVMKAIKEKMSQLKKATESQPRAEEVKAAEKLEEETFVDEAQTQIQ